jgi:glutamate-1-semialdehyde 2,1-aminomutase
VQMPLFLFDDDPEMRKGFFWSSEMLKRGIYVHPWHNMFMSAAMTEADIDSALDAAEGAFATLKAKRTSLPPIEKLRAFLTPRAAPALAEAD